MLANAMNSADEIFFKRRLLIELLFLDSPIASKWILFLCLINITIGRKYISILQWQSNGSQYGNTCFLPRSCHYIAVVSP